MSSEPSLITDEGRKYWFANGNIHREDGPAIVSKDESHRWWYFNGKIHRIDGPAYEAIDGTKVWCINNINITDQVNEWLDENNITYPFNEDTLTQFKLRFA